MTNNKENNLMKKINELKNTNELYKNVIEDILEDAEGYNGEELQEQIEGRLEDILQHGCISGTVGSLIYCSDTIKFYEEYKENINELLYQTMEETGLHSMEELFGNNFDKEDPLCIEQMNQNLLAWFGYEEVARQLMYEINPNW